MRNGERAPGAVDTVTEAAALAALPGDLALPGDESRAERAPRRERGERNDRGDRPEGARRERGDRRPRGESTDGIAGEAGTSGSASESAGLPRSHDRVLPPGEDAAVTEAAVQQASGEAGVPAAESDERRERRSRDRYGRDRRERNGERGANGERGERADRPDRAPLEATAHEEAPQGGIFDAFRNPTPIASEGAADVAALSTGAALPAHVPQAPAERRPQNDDTRRAPRAPRNRPPAEGGEGEAPAALRAEALPTESAVAPAVPAAASTPAFVPAAEPVAAPVAPPVPRPAPAPAPVAAAPAPVAAPAPAAPAPVAAVPAPAPAPAAVAAAAPKAAPAPFVLPVNDLARLAEGSGLQWVGSDATKIAAAQAAMAAEPAAVRVPRERPPVVAAEDSALVLVETKRDLRDVKLAFENAEPVEPAAPQPGTVPPAV